MPPQVGTTWIVGEDFGGLAELMSYNAETWWAKVNAFYYSCIVTSHT